MPSTQQILVGTAAVVATSVVGYAVYFDYRRRHDADFRRKLRKEHNKVHHVAAKEAREQKAKTTQMLKAHLVQISKESLPSNPAEREQYFMEQVAMGEGLAQAGPINEVPAALCFYRALRVYPSPVELIMIYQKTVPAPIFSLLMELTSLDVATKSPSTTTGTAPSSAAAAAQIDDGEGEGEDGEGEKTPSAGESTNGSGSGSGSGEWEDVVDSEKN